MEAESLGHAWRAVVPIELLVLMVRPREVPDRIHPAMVPADEVARADHDSRPKTFVIAVHLGVTVLARKTVGTRIELR